MPAETRKYIASIESHFGLWMEDVAEEYRNAVNVVRALGRRGTHTPAHAFTEDVHFLLIGYAHGQHIGRIPSYEAEQFFRSHCQFNFGEHAHIFGKSEDELRKDVLLSLLHRLFQVEAA